MGSYPNLIKIDRSTGTGIYVIMVNFLVFGCAFCLKLSFAGNLELWTILGDHVERSTIKDQKKIEYGRYSSLSKVWKHIEIAHSHSNQHQMTPNKL